MTNHNDAVEILLVEDNPTDAELCIRALKRHNFTNRLEWVKDGAEALDFIFARGKYADRDGSEVPRVILLDLRLPKVDGIEVLRQIKANELTRTIPVVVLTSSKEDRDIVDSYTRLHELGHAHSVETWKDKQLAGGLYGVAVGGAQIAQVAVAAFLQQVEAG